MAKILPKEKEINKAVLKLLYHLFILYLICNNLSVQSKPLDIPSNSSYIIIKTNVTGNIKIISDSFSPLPDEVIINGEVNTTSINEYYLNAPENIIILIWNKELTCTDNMFKECSNIAEIDLSNFDTSLVTSMRNMFYGCSSLRTLNLSNICTSKVMAMNHMFCGCSSLSSLDLSYFDTSEVMDMNYMFQGCSSLNALDLSSFDTSKVVFINNIFKECSKLDYLNLKYADINKNILLDLTSPSLVICSENDNLIDLFMQKQNINCNYNQSYTNINNNKCYSNNSLFDNNKHICSICGTDYYKIINNSNDNNSYINCYESPEGYYLDQKELIYKSCYTSCKTCDIIGNDSFHNCIKCKEDYLYEANITNYKNCYKNKPDDIISDIIYNSYNSYELTTDLADEVEIKDTLEKKTNEVNRTELIKDIIDDIFNGLNISDINNGKDKKIKEKNIEIIFTSTLNQKNNEDINNISMNLGECEDILKKDYNISNNAPLYILQIISEEPGMKIPKIEYQVYYPLNNSNKIDKLDLSSCKDTKIELSIAVKINDTLDKYDSRSDYYNDICSKSTSESGTDISLKDRRNEFVDNNMTLCEENCELTGYNYDKEKVKCSCDIKLKIPENYDIKFNKKDFFKSFIDVNNFANINIMKCYKTVLRIKSLLKNYGFFIMLFIFLFYIITFIIFWIISYNKLKKDIKKIIIIFNKIEEINNIQKDDNKIKANKKNKKRTKRNNNKETKEHTKKAGIKDNKKIKYENNAKQITENIEDKPNKIINIIKKNISEFGFGNGNNMKYKYIINLIEQKDFELNALDYEDAIKLDKRSFFQYYISLLKNNHPFIFSFFPYEDYNSKVIKIFLFFFSFSLDFTINALFFSDETMHKIYEDKGKFNFLYQIPQILYSTLISKFIDSFIRRLALTQDIIVGLKQEKEKTNRKIRKIVKIIKIKLISFFIITFMTLIFFWYYILCFCGIYVNTQKHLIKDSVFSLLTGLLYPFAICLIPGIFRIASIRIEKLHGSFLYKLSVFMENYIC